MGSPRSIADAGSANGGGGPTTAGSGRLSVVPGLPMAALGLGVAAAVVVVGGAVAAPLLVYSLTLATFGAAHVLSELAYVDRRFAGRIDARRLALMIALLLLAAAARAAGVFKLADPATAITAELSAVVLLALTAAAGGLLQRATALLLAAGIGGATLAAPFDTAVAFSILHNLTPLAFLYEIAPPSQRRRVMALALAAFVGLPLLVATGLPRLALAALGIPALELDPIGAGALADHLYVYVPRPLLAGAHAADLFSASVVAQCAHYAAVIVVLPLLLARLDPGARGVLPWPRTPWLPMLIAAASAAMLYRFTLGFVPARSLYGIAASIHAWIEIPLIVIALTGRRPQPVSSIPTATEAALATSETASARGPSSPAAQATTAASTTTTTASARTAVGT